MVKAWLKLFVLTALTAALFPVSGCIGPHYTNKDVILNGKPAPRIHGPHDPVIEANLTTNLWTKAPLPARAGEVVVTIAKSAGIQGWKDYHMHAQAVGTVAQHEFSSNGFLTMDLRLATLTVRGVHIAMPGARYMRVEIFLGKVSVDKSIYTQTNTMIFAGGKFVWDSDGWFEIHPQETGDVRPAWETKSEYIRRSREGSF